jgi:hypothetical protein
MPLAGGAARGRETMKAHRSPRPMLPALRTLALASALALGSVALPACARIETRAAKGPVPDGVRIYPPRVLLFVDAEYDRGKGRSSLVVVPDLGNAYDVRQETFLAKNDLQVEVEDGMLRSFWNTIDTTPALAFFKGAGDVGAKTAGIATGVSAREMEGTFGLATGIYALRPDGSFAPLPKLVPKK